MSMFCVMRHGLDDIERSLLEDVEEARATDPLARDEGEAGLRRKIAGALGRGRRAQARTYAKVLVRMLAQRGEIATEEGLLREIEEADREHSQSPQPDEAPSSAPEPRSSKNEAQRDFRDKAGMVAKIGGPIATLAALLTKLIGLW